MASRMVARGSAPPRLATSFQAAEGTLLGSGHLDRTGLGGRGSGVRQGTRRRSAIVLNARRAWGAAAIELGLGSHGMRSRPRRLGGWVGRFLGVNRSVDEDVCKPAGWAATKPRVDLVAGSSGRRADSALVVWRRGKLRTPTDHELPRRENWGHPPIGTSYGQCSRGSWLEIYQRQAS